MLSDISILRRLPPGLKAKELVALDAIRQCTDIIGVADSRIREVLTEISDSKGATDLQITSCFLDAWSFVDAVDRIRSMAKLLARRSSDLQTEVSTFIGATESVRELRNLADHLDKRIDQILSSNLPAIGQLSWVTLTSTRAALVGILEPGTLRTTKKSIKIPQVGGRPVRVPTGAVKLTSGTYVCWLDDVMAAVSSLIAVIETNIDEHVLLNGLSGQEVGRNILLIGEVSFEDVAPTEIYADGQQRLF